VEADLISNVSYIPSVIPALSQGLRRSWTTLGEEMRVWVGAEGFGEGALEDLHDAV